MGFVTEVQKPLSTTRILFLIHAAIRVWTHPPHEREQDDQSQVLQEYVYAIDDPPPPPLVLVVAIDDPPPPLGKVGCTTPVRLAHVIPSE